MAVSVLEMGLEPMFQALAGRNIRVAMIWVSSELDEGEQNLTDDEEVAVGMPYDDMDSSSTIEPESEDEVFAKRPAVVEQEDVPPPGLVQEQSLPGSITRPARARRAPARFIGGQWWNAEVESDDDLV